MNIEDALQNWARWARDRAIQGHCASIEYRFRFRTSPDVDWNEAPPVVPLPQIDVLQAIEIERCMRHLPDGHRKALKLAYVDRMPRKMVCLHLVIAYRDYGRYLDDARCMVENLYFSRKKEYKCSTIRQTSIPCA